MNFTISSVEGICICGVEKNMFQSCNIVYIRLKMFYMRFVVLKPDIFLWNPVFLYNIGKFVVI